MRFSKTPAYYMVSVHLFRLSVTFQWHRRIVKCGCGCGIGEPEGAA